jgi:hypothetical protein
MKQYNFLNYDKWEYTLSMLAIISLFISCLIISSKTHFWNDEYISYYIVSVPSFYKMLLAFHDKINNTPILYFLLGWLWNKPFGSSELSLRLFSFMGMSMSLLLLDNLTSYL